nr:uncharacterized protein LOC128688558 isoform X1 [Cherax quadricarinatus]
MNPGKLYFIPQLFKPPTKEYSAVSQNDPFVAHEVLQEYCSLFASDGSGVPSYISRDPDISSIIDFPAESWDKIAKVQMQREKIETKAEDKEATTAPKQQEVDHLKRTLDQTVDRIFNKHGFFVKKPCPVMIPYKSTLNHAEHKAYLRAFVKFKIRAPTTAADASEYGQYLRLQHRVYEEQNCFMQFSHQVSRLQLPAYNLVPDVIKNYVNDYVQHRCKRSSNYKTLYVHEQQVPICPQDPTKRFHSLSLTHIGHLLSLVRRIFSQLSHILENKFYVKFELSLAT